MAEEVYESDLINMVIGTHMSIGERDCEDCRECGEDECRYDADFQQESAGIEL